MRYNQPTARNFVFSTAEKPQNPWHLHNWSSWNFSIATEDVPSLAFSLAVENITKKKKEGQKWKL